ncbi:MAG: phosphotransferase [Myxococcales bacterium]|nr:phosphotransferase [Myxococcales bacterium]
MVLKPWAAERAVDAALARELIGRQFPQLARARVEPVGEGWDNTVFSVDGTYVFRFPRRRIAVQSIEREIVVLPQIAARLPLPIPVPEMIGAPEDRFPWPFAGYRMLPGRTADQAALSVDRRTAAAPTLAKFLRALHAVPLDAGRDSIDRLDATRLRDRTSEWLRELDLPPPPWFEEPVRAPVPRALVHGDLHARQILIDSAGAVCGVIDWGDVHFGDPACDFAVAWTFLPPQGRAKFRSEYGSIDDETWRLARLRGLHLSAALAVYARGISDEQLFREALAALDFVRIS